MVVDVVVLGEEPVTEHPVLGQLIEVVREVVHVFERLELRFGERVVVGHTGRECDLVMPRSDSNAETGLDVIDIPLSAWTVWGAAAIESSAAQTRYPGEYRDQTCEGHHLAYGSFHRRLTR